MLTNTPEPLPPVAPATQSKKGTSPLVWILVGCGSLMVIAAIVVAGVIWWGAHKIKNYAGDIQRNPAVAVAKLVVAANPDLEIVSQNYQKGTLTIRNKKTGEVITMDAKDIKQGRLKFKNEKGEEVTLQGSSEEGKGELTVTSKEGTMTFNTSGGQSLPAWVPSYPGVTPMVTMSKSGDEGLYGNFSFQTADPAQKVLEYFANKLKATGFSVEKNNTQGGLAVIGNLHATGDEGKRKVDVSVIPFGNVSQVSVQYSTSGGVKD